jgi:hypothetical protein
VGVTHHDGMSVQGSGYYVGKKNDERTQLPTGLARVDAGSFSVSGWKNLSVSTKLSSVTWVVTTPQFPATGLTAMASGNVAVIGATPSGHLVDFTMFSLTSGLTVGQGLTSCGTSNVITWVAIGT